MLSLAVEQVGLTGCLSRVSFFQRVSGGCLPLDSIKVPVDSSGRLLKLRCHFVERNRQEEGPT